VGESGRTAPDLSVVILNYNVRELLALALRTALVATRGLDVEIIVVDNASPDDSADMVESDFPQVHLIRNDTNAGFAAGNNVGFGVARGRHIAILNPDVIVHPDAFRAIVEYLDAHSETGAVGGQIINPDGSVDPGSRRGFPSPSAAFYRMVGLSYIFPRSERFGRYNLSYLSDNEVFDDVDAVSGCFMCVRRDVLETVGGLDEDYFMYGEDLDWCLRIRSAGWKIASITSAEIIHFKNASLKTLPRLRQVYVFHQAMHIFVRKNIAPKSNAVTVALVEAGIILRGLGASTVRLLRAAMVPALDFSFLMLAVVLAFVARMATGWTIPEFTLQEQALLALAFGGSAIAGTIGAGLYGRRAFNVKRTALATAAGALICITAIFFVKSINFSRIVTGLAWLFAGTLNIGWRWIVGRRLKEPPARGLVLGAGARARAFLGRVRQHEGRYRILGLIDDAESHEQQTIEGYPVLGTVDDLPLLLRRLRVDDLIVAWDDTYRYRELLVLIRASGGDIRRVRLVTDDVMNGEDRGPNGGLPLIDLTMPRSGIV
jgi:O-antigen biosynthesis protein